MFLLTILILTVILLVIFLVLAFSISGAVGIILFGDVIVCAVVIIWIIRKLIKKN